MARIISRLAWFLLVVGAGAASFAVVYRLLEPVEAGPARVVGVSTAPSCPTQTPPQKAIDGSTAPADFWECAAGWPLPFNFVFNRSFVLKSYQLLAGESADRMPMAWTLYGSNTGNNWTAIDVRDAVTDWKVNSAKSFDLELGSDSAYSRYRFAFERPVSGIIRIYEIKLHPRSDVTQP